MQTKLILLTLAEQCFRLTLTAVIRSARLGSATTAAASAQTLRTASASKTAHQYLRLKGQGIVPLVLQTRSERRRADSSQHQRTYDLLAFGLCMGMMGMVLVVDLGTASVLVVGFRVDFLWRAPTLIILGVSLASSSWIVRRTLAPDWLLLPNFFQIRLKHIRLLLAVTKSRNTRLRRHCRLYRNKLQTTKHNFPLLHSWRLDGYDGVWEGFDDGTGDGMMLGLVLLFVRAFLSM